MVRMVSRLRGAVSAATGVAPLLAPVVVARAAPLWLLTTDGRVLPERRRLGLKGGSLMEGCKEEED